MRIVFPDVIQWNALLMENVRTAKEREFIFLMICPPGQANGADIPARAFFGLTKF